MKICEEQILTRKELLDSSLRNMEILGRQEFINWKSLSCNFSPMHVKKIMKMS